MERKTFIRLLSAGAATILTGRSLSGKTRQQVGGGCDGCNLIYAGMPDRLLNSAQLPGWKEGREKMIVEGRLLRKDGKTPAANVILYIYHTDNKGYYSTGPGQVNARRHGHNRGWVRTGADGSYRFYTAKPAPYPEHNDPAHIHPVIKEPGKNEYYIDEYVFDGDPLLTAVVRKKAENRGGSGIVKLVKNNTGGWVCRRDIVLGLNVPNYV